MEIPYFRTSMNTSSTHLSEFVIQISHPSKMSFTAVPVLDLAKANDPATKPELLEQLRHALMEVGFLYIQNTTISNGVLEQVKAAGKAVFDIPEEEK